MQPTLPCHFGTSIPAAATMAPEDYARLLHPVGARGKASAMIFDGAERPRTWAFELANLPAALAPWLETSSYLSLNRFHGPRRTDRLAALGALYVDLDFYRVGTWSRREPGVVRQALETFLEDRNIPAPSIVVDTGRGLAAVWLLQELPAAALPRWRAAQRALIELCTSFGADRACSDPTRVFRLPGTLNPKSGRLVKVISGSCARYDFDEVADAAYVALGRPRRRDLAKRRAAKKMRKERQARDRRSGLSPAARFSAVLEDLQTIRAAWGGKVPTGLRNTWLHLYATALTHRVEPEEIPHLVAGMAATAAPGLPAKEVEGLAEAAKARARGGSSCVPSLDSRYHYSGERIAEMLAVSDGMARALGLTQTFSRSERARRKAIREKTRRAAAGAADRADWLAAHGQEQAKPWIALGVSRPTYFRWKRTGKLPSEPAAGAEALDETGPCPLQGGYATPRGPGERRSRAPWSPEPHPTPDRQPTDSRGRPGESDPVPARFVHGHTTRPGAHETPPQALGPPSVQTAAGTCPGCACHGPPVACHGRWREDDAGQGGPSPGVGSGRQTLSERALPGSRLLPEDDPQPVDADVQHHASRTASGCVQAIRLRRLNELRDVVHRGAGQPTAGVQALD